MHVTWDVGGSPAETVTISCSTAVSPSWPAHSQRRPAHRGVLPCGVTSSDCRIWVQPNVAGVAQYFDVSDADFSLTDGLPDFAPVPNFPGWSDAVAVSPTDDQAADNAPLPGALFGDATSYLAYAWGNYGDAFGCGAFVSSLRVDEVVRLDNVAPPAPGFGAYNWNLATDISGGRHTIWQINDPDNLIPELDETNNAYARQWVWEPQILDNEIQQLRAHPPERFAGTQHLPDGVPVYTNKDAMRIPANGGYWRGMAVSNPDPAHDYDAYLYPPSAGVESGIANDQVAVSAAGGAFTDAVISNANTMGFITYDAGVLNWNGAATDYRLESRSSDAVLFVGDEIQPSHGRVPDAAHGGVLHRRAAAGPGDPGAQERPHRPARRTWPCSHPTSPRATSTTRPTRRRWAPTAGRWCSSTPPWPTTTAAAIYRHAFEGTAAFDYDLRLWQTPADLAAVTLPGSHAPLIPRNDADIGIGDPVPADDQLDGDTFNTVLYYHLANLGPVASAPFQLAFQFDGVTVDEFQPPFPAELPGDPNLIWSQGRGAFNVRGGRHTAGMIVDSQNSNLEILEDNNRYGEQWVWLPTQLAPESAIGRATPPLRDGGWDDVADGVPLYDNVDGLRSQTFSEGDYWAAVADAARGRRRPRPAPARADDGAGQRFRRCAGTVRVGRVVQRVRAHRFRRRQLLGQRLGCRCAAVLGRSPL